VIWHPSSPYRYCLDGIPRSGLVGFLVVVEVLEGSCRLKMEGKGPQICGKQCLAPVQSFSGVGREAATGSS